MKNDREKQSSKQNCPRADGMSPVQHARCASADSSFISSRACYICSKVPKTRQTDSSSVALLGLLETVAGNQLAVRIFKLFVTVRTNTPKRLSARCRCSTSVWSPRVCRRFKRGVRDNDKQGQFGKIVIMQMEPLNLVYPAEEGCAVGQLDPHPPSRSHVTPPKPRIF